MTRRSPAVLVAVLTALVGFGLALPSVHSRQSSSSVPGD